MSVVVLENVHASDAAGPKGRARGRVSGATVAFGPGVHVVLGGPDDGLLAFAGVLSGAARPTRGKVLVAARDLHRTPAVRARVGVLDVDPRLPPARTVAESVRLAMRARGDRAVAIDAILDPLGLSTLHGRRLHSLAYGEARSVELALALSTPAPLMLALHEPFSDVGLAASAVVRGRLRDLASTGVCVVVTTSSPADARAIADHVYILRAGVIALDGPPDALDTIDRGAPAELVAWVSASGLDDEAHTSAMRAFGAGVAAAPGVVGSGWDRPPGMGRVDPLVLRVRAVSGAAASTAVIGAAVESGVELEAFAPASASLGAVRAAADAILRARFALRPAPPPPPPSHQPPPPPLAAGAPPMAPGAP